MTKLKFFNHDKSKCTQRGVATIEFAILIVPLLLLLFGVTEYGRAIYQYNTLAKSVRDATRYLSGLSSEQVYFNQAKNIAVCGHTDCSGKEPLISGLKSSMVHVGTNSVGSINMVTVTVNHPSLNEKFAFHSAINFAIGGFTVGAPDITFGPIQNTMRQI